MAADDTDGRGKGLIALLGKYKDAVRKNLKYFILGPFFMIIEAGGEFILPYLNANVINKGVADGDISYIIRNGLLMAVIAVIMLAAGVLGCYFAVNGASRLAADLRMNVYEQIQRFSFSNIDDFSTGSLITRVTNDITQIQNFAQSLLRGCFRSPVMMIGAIVMSFLLDKRLAVVICIVIPLLAAAIFFIINSATPRYSAMQEQLDNMNNEINETITNEKVIKSFVREDYEDDKFKGVNKGLRDKSIRALELMILLQPVSTLAINATTLAVVWIAGRQIMVGSVAIGTLTAFITYLTQILNALNFMANIFLQGTRAFASDKRISEVLDARIDLADNHPVDECLPVKNGDIRFCHVYFRYFKNNSRWVLNDINLHIKSGEFVGIVGSTGSGKSTLISLIPRLYDVDKGSVMVGGVDVRDCDLEDLRDQVSIVLQQNTLFSGTIAENLQWGDENASLEDMDWACKIAHAKEFIDTFPDGYETELEQGGRNLSGGQRQRLCLARALLKRPKILILDDSTSAVDTATDAGIRQALRKELSGTTKIVIAQRIGSVIDADKIVVMDEGKIVDVGSHAELIERCLPYQEIYYSQKDREAMA